MPSETFFYGLPYLVGPDKVASTDEVMQALAERLDLMLGEAGQRTFVDVPANTNVVVQVNYQRDYTDAYAEFGHYPHVTPVLNTQPQGQVTLWTTGHGPTGFQLGIRAVDAGTYLVLWGAAI